MTSVLRLSCRQIARLERRRGSCCDCRIVATHLSTGVRHPFTRWARRDLKNWSGLRSARSVANCRRLCAESVQYIRLTAMYLTTVRQVIINVVYLHMKRLATTLKMFIFTQVIAAQVGMFIIITSSN